MTFNEFISKYENKGLDWDGAYGEQCVDLVRFYWDSVCEISQPRGVNGAKDFWYNFWSDPIFNKNFAKIPNTQDGVPQKGDVMIWGDKYGPWGHIAVFISGDINSFKVFSQNDPSGTLSIQKDYRDYFGVLGWFRPNKNVNEGSNELEGDNMLLKYLGMPNEEEAIKKLTEHLGETVDRCDWGNSDDSRGGFLGGSRRRVLDLENEIDSIRQSDNISDEDDLILNGRTVTYELGNTTITDNYKVLK